MIADLLISDEKYLSMIFLLLIVMNDARPAARGGEGGFFRATQAGRGRAREDSNEKRIPPAAQDRPERQGKGIQGGGLHSKQGSRQDRSTNKRRQESAG